MESNASADHREPCTTGKVARQNEWPGDERLLPGRACTDSAGQYREPHTVAGSARSRVKGTVIGRHKSWPHGHSSTELWTKGRFL